MDTQTFLSLGIVAYALEETMRYIKLKYGTTGFTTMIIEVGISLLTAGVLSYFNHSPFGETFYDLIRNATMIWATLRNLRNFKE